MTWCSTIENSNIWKESGLTLVFRQVLVSIHVTAVVDTDVALKIAEVTTSFMPTEFRSACKLQLQLQWLQPLQIRCHYIFIVKQPHFHLKI